MTGRVVAVVQSLGATGDDPLDDELASLTADDQADTIAAPPSADP